MKIKLTPSEIYWAACVGVMRQTQNIQNKKRQMYGVDAATKDWQVHIEGALGEMALAKHLGIYWSGKGEMKEPDVGVVDVRTTPLNDGRLILHPNDDDERKFWLLTGYNGVYDVRGWIYGVDGKQKKFWSDPAGNRPAYFVKQKYLN